MNYYSSHESEKNLEDSTIKYIYEFIDGQNRGEDISHYFGELSFIYSKDEIQSINVEIFLMQILKTEIYLSKYFCNHIKNFMEIVLFYKPEIISSYLDMIRNIEYIEYEDNISIMESAVILPGYKNKIATDKILTQIMFPWRSYYELANCFLYYNKFLEALRYIFKAIATCPNELKNEYKKKSKYIINSIRTNVGVIDLNL